MVAVGLYDPPRSCDSDSLLHIKSVRTSEILSIVLILYLLFLGRPSLSR